MKNVLKLRDKKTNLKDSIKLNLITKMKWLKLIED